MPQPRTPLPRVPQPREPLLTSRSGIIPLVSAGTGAAIAAVACAAGARVMEAILLGGGAAAGALPILHRLAG